jgi:hypothetical protein
LLKELDLLGLLCDELLYTTEPAVVAAVAALTTISHATPRVTHTRAVGLSSKSEKARRRLTTTMRDRQGTERGECRTAGCVCREYQLPQNGNACDYCGHRPTEHAEQQTQQQPQPHTPTQGTPTPTTTATAPAPATPPPPKAKQPGTGPGDRQYTPTMPQIAVASKKPKQKKGPLDWMLDKLKEKKH